jgi:DNA polymerase I
MLVFNTNKLVPDERVIKARTVAIKQLAKVRQKISAKQLAAKEILDCSRVLSIDLESHLIAPHSNRLPRVVCVSVLDSNDEDNTYLYARHEGGWAVSLLDAINDENCIIASHYAAFDLSNLLNTLVELFGEQLKLSEEDISDLYLAVINKAVAGKVLCSKVYGNILNIGKNHQRGFAPNLAKVIKEMYGIDMEGKEGKLTDGKADKEEDEFEDTAENALDPAKIIKEATEEEDVWRKRYAELDGIPLEKWPMAASLYAARDAVYHRAAFDAIAIQQLYQQKIAHTWAVNTAADLTFTLAGNRGILTDLQLTKVFDKENRIVLKTSAQKLSLMGLLSVSQKRDGTIKITKKRKVLQDMVVQLAADQGIEYLQTKSGKPSTTESALMLVDHSRTLLPWAEYSAAEKLNSTYIPVLKRGILYPDYNVLVESFRSSCRNPNVQNLPRKGRSRECIIPGEGRVFIGADYDIAELASLSEVVWTLFGYSVMGDKIVNGQDIHLWMASKLLNIEYEDVKALYGTDDEAAITARQLSKALDFGYPGGLGPKNFIGFARGYGVDVTLEQSKMYKRVWMDAFPDMKQYFDYINSAVGGFGARGPITHPITGAVRGGCTFTQAANFLFQHLTAIIAKDAWSRATAEGFDKRSPLYGFRSSLFIHDEIIGSIPRDVASAGAFRLAEIMHESACKYSKHVPAKAAPYMMERWIKGAKGVYNAAGELIPFVPKVKKVAQEETKYADVCVADLEELAA